MIFVFRIFFHRGKDKYGHLHPNQGMCGSGQVPPQLQSRQSSSSLGSGGRSSSAGTKPQPLQPRNQFSDPASSNPSAACVGPSKSLNSFQRQESAASFHSGTSAQSTQSAPTCPNHTHHKYPVPGQQITSAQSLHHHIGASGSTGRGKYPMDKRSIGAQQQRGGGGPPPLPQHCGMSKQPPPPPPHLGMLPPPPPQPGNMGNFESCSTQSSSSSASAPPDYATYPGKGNVKKESNEHYHLYI